MAKPVEKSWFSMKAANDGASADIAIYSDIGDWGVTAAMFRDSLGTLGDVKTLRLNISSNGGDVAAGFAIFNMLDRHPAHKIVTVDGLAASMASVIAMVGDEVIMPSNSMLMIHNPWGAIGGDADTLISFGEALAKMRESIAAAYVARSGQSLADIHKMMDKETWLSAGEAVELGFADRVDEPRQMRASIDISKFSRVPKSFGRKMESVMKKSKTNAAAETDSESETETSNSVKTETEIRAEIIATQNEIRSMCKIAGKPEMADAFIKADKKPSDVLAELDKLAAGSGKGKKDKSADNEVNAHNNPGNSTEARVIDPAAIYNKYNKRKSA